MCNATSTYKYLVDSLLIMYFILSYFIDLITIITFINLHIHVYVNFNTYLYIFLFLCDFI